MFLSAGGLGWGSRWGGISEFWPWSLTFIGWVFWWGWGVGGCLLTTCAAAILLIPYSKSLVSLRCLLRSLGLHHRSLFPPLQRFMPVLFLGSFLPQIVGPRVELPVGIASRFMLGAQPSLC
jgi:hypothetical protein